MNSVLSKNEKAILLLLLQGCSTKEIAQSLKLSANTIKTYKQRIKLKLDARTIAHAIQVTFCENIFNIEKINKIQHQLGSDYSYHQFVNLYFSEKV